MEFSGFKPETVDFLWGIRFNNNKPWFEEHKKDYVNYLYEPMKALGAALYEPLQSTPGLGYKVSRIYKDTRFSHGDPYKDHLWISIRRETDRWSDVPTLFFEIRPEGYGFGLVYWQPSAAVMQAFRTDLTERPEVLELIEQAERDSGCTLQGQEYARKRFDAPRPELERFFRLKGFFATKNCEPNELLFQPELAARVSATLQALLPLNEYLQTLSTRIVEKAE